MGTEERDWVEWHRVYDDPDSHMGRRLVVVQQRIREAVDRMPPGKIRVVSVCAGQGIDLIGALADHPRRRDVVGRLVELQPGNCAAAVEQARAVGINELEALPADGGITDSYAGAVPADLVLCCGTLGHVAPRQIANFVGSIDQLCAPGATIIWTRHRKAPDLTPAMRRWFRQAGFEELSIDMPGEAWFVVGQHRLVEPPRELQSGVRMFTFGSRVG